VVSLEGTAKRHIVDWILKLATARMKKTKKNKLAARQMKDHFLHDTSTFPPLTE